MKGTSPPVRCPVISYKGAESMTRVPSATTYYQDISKALEDCRSKIVNDCGMPPPCQQGANLPHEQPVARLERSSLPPGETAIADAASDASTSQTLIPNDMAISPDESLACGYCNLFCQGMSNSPRTREDYGFPCCCLSVRSRARELQRRLILAAAESLDGCRERLATAGCCHDHKAACRSSGRCCAASPAGKSHGRGLSQGWVPSLPSGGSSRKWPCNLDSAGAQVSYEDLASILAEVHGAFVEKVHGTGQSCTVVYYTLLFA